MNNQDRIIAVVAHITIVGWVIAMVMNAQKRGEFAGFYIRQCLGLHALAAIGSFIPGVRLVIGVVVLILLILSLIGAVNGKKSPSPYIGNYFQDWFKGV